MTVSYEQKLHAFKPKCRWFVEADNLRWETLEGQSRNGTIPFDRIKWVRLRYEPTRPETRRVALHIHTPTKHTITNIHYASILNFKAQKEEFETFLEAFHAAIPSSSSIKFYRGSTWPAFIGVSLLTIVIGALLLFTPPLISVTGVPGETFIFRLVIILIFLPILIRYFIKNRPQTYKPDDWPRDILA